MRAKELYPGVFSRHAASYRARVRELRSPGRLRALELLDARPGELIADLACGPGNLSRAVAAAGATAIGVDLAPGMLALAREDMPGELFLLGDLEMLPLAGSRFDAAVCGHGLQFAPDLDAALAEAARILRPGGRLAACAPLAARADTRAEIVEPVADRWLGPRLRPDDPIDRLRIDDPGRWRQAAMLAGFRAATAERVEGPVGFESPRRYVELAMGWWDLAARIEHLPLDRVRGFQDELTAALEARFGTGPFELPGAENVLYALL